jgi:hypothetical protein
MKKKLLCFLLCGMMLIGLTGCGGNNSKSSSDVVTDLNNLIEQCSKENTGDSSWKCMLNENLQTYFKTYSDYRLLNVSQSEFVAKPQDDNNLMAYGILTDKMCNYDYVLIYNSKAEQSYSVKLSCEDNIPSFDTATELK